MADVFEIPAKPRKVSATLLNRATLLLYDFCEQLRRHGLQHTATEVSVIASQLAQSPEILPDPPVAKKAAVN